MQENGRVPRRRGPGGRQYKAVGTRVREKDGNTKKKQRYKSLLQRGHRTGNGGIVRNDERMSQEQYEGKKKKVLRGGEGRQFTAVVSIGTRGGVVERG